MFICQCHNYDNNTRKAGKHLVVFQLYVKICSTISIQSTPGQPGVAQRGHGLSVKEFWNKMIFFTTN